MPEDVATLPAESSPAAETPQATKQETVSVPTNAEDYAQWRLTGKLPDEPSKGDSAPPNKKPSSGDSAPPAKKSPSSGDSATPHLKRQGYGDQRKEELNEEIRELIAKRDQIRQEVEAKQPAQRDVKAAAEPSNAQPADRPKKPKQEDFKTWDEYETAADKYSEALVDWKANQKIEEYIQRQKQEAATQEMQVRLDKAKERYGDEAESTIVGTAKAVFDETKIAPAIKTALGRSDVMVDALYVMGSDKKELDAFIDLSIKDPLEALRKWFTIEALVRQELQKPARAQPPPSNGAPQRDEDGKFVSVKAPPARISRQAPAPPTELGGNSSPPGDELERAAASGDVRGFMQEANRRDFARWKGQI